MLIVFKTFHLESAHTVVCVCVILHVFIYTHMHMHTHTQSIRSLIRSLISVHVKITCLAHPFSLREYFASIGGKTVKESHVLVAI